jgi:hypothetical protein
MSVFDSVRTPCPACGAPLEFQSKSGDCLLRSFTLWDAPVDVVIGTYPQTCSTCKRQWRLVLPPVNAIIREVREVYEDETN